MAYFSMNKRKLIKTSLRTKPSLRDWTDLVLPETKETKKVDAQEILKEMRYGVIRCS